MAKTHSPIKNLSQENAYLVTNTDIRGVGRPYAIEADFRAASAPLDPTTLVGSVTSLPMAAIPSPIIGKYIRLPDGTVATPALSWASDSDTGLYRESDGVFSLSINATKEVEFNSSGIKIVDLTATRVVFSGTGGQLTDDAGLTYNASTDTLTAAVGFRAGTATDTATAGDVAFGLAGASRLFFDQSAQSLFLYDSAGNADFKLNVAGDSWYNGSGKFGFGTVTPDAQVEIVESSGASQLRLTYADSIFYTDLRTNSQGYLLLRPSDGRVLMDLDIPGNDVQFYVHNADDSSTSSHARILIQSSLATGAGGDPLIEWTTDPFGSNTSFCMGLDNSVSGDPLTISVGSALGTNNALSITTARNATFSCSTATTTPILDLTQASTGDSAQRFALGSTISYIWGIDNSVAGDPFVLATAASASAVLGTGNLLTITSAGLMGLGVSPTTLLQLLAGTAVGSTYSTDDLLTIEQTAACNINIVTNTTGSSTILFSDTTRARGRVGYAHTTDALTFFTAAAQAMLIDSSQNVGIGTSGPDAKLDVLSTSVQLRLTHTDGSVYAGLQADSSGNLLFTPTGDYAGLSVSKATVVGFLCQNTENATATSHSLMSILSGGASGGDPLATFTVSGATSFSIGIDNSDSDKFKISGSGALGTTDRLTIGSDGETIITQWLQVGTATDAATAGDAVFGLTGAARMFFDQSAAELQFINATPTVIMRIMTQGSLGVSYANTSVWAGGYSSPDAGRIIFGDSGGWKFHFSTRSASTTTDRVTIGDNNNAGGFVVNDAQDDYDVRFEGDSISHLFWCDATATTENIALLAASAPGWNTMDRGLFIGDTSNAPTGNPTAGGYMYSNAGAGTWRGSGGTVTAFGPAGPHCGTCGYDFWEVASHNDNWGAHLRKCGWCGTVYKKGPKSVLHLLTEQQKTELVYE